LVRHLFSYVAIACAEVFAELGRFARQSPINSLPVEMSANIGDAAIPLTSETLRLIGQPEYFAPDLLLQPQPYPYQSLVERNKWIILLSSFPFSSLCWLYGLINFLFRLFHLQIATWKALCFPQLTSLSLLVLCSFPRAANEVKLSQIQWPLNQSYPILKAVNFNNFASPQNP
jgi:hypothetical protein